MTKTCVLQIRLTPEELIRIKRFAAQSQCTVSNLIRREVLNVHQQDIPKTKKEPLSKTGWWIGSKWFEPEKEK